MVEAPLILTLRLDDATQGLFAGLRKAHFPPERNLVPAHLTLFHKLPGADLDAIRAVLTRLAGETPAFPMQVDAVRFLGAGSAYSVSSKHLQALHSRLATRWADWLTPQDRQPFRPHVTIQNKADPVLAKALHARLADRFEPFAAQGEGLLLWHYLGGPWRLADRFDFRG